jgi:hypothetical protein
MKFGISEALKSLVPNIDCTVLGDGTIIWEDANGIFDTTQPSNAEIDAEINKLQVAYDAQAYSRSRGPEYPSWQEQADMQYWDAINGTTTWADTISDIKLKYPKENT